jgi:hypothetical protein
MNVIKMGYEYKRSSFLFQTGFPSGIFILKKPASTQNLSLINGNCLMMRNVKRVHIFKIIILCYIAGKIDDE